MLREFADRGINLDGSFMKHEYGGVFIVACCKNSNNEIQIAAVAWVSGETKVNWSWLLDFLLRFVEATAFFISDRDKDLIPAMQVKAGDIPHFFVFVTCSRISTPNFAMRHKRTSYGIWPSP